VGVSQTLRRWTEGATYIRQGDHHVGHWPTFLVIIIMLTLYVVNIDYQSMKDVCVRWYVASRAHDVYRGVSSLCGLPQLRCRALYTRVYTYIHHAARATYGAECRYFCRPHRRQWRQLHLESVQHRLNRLSLFLSTRSYTCIYLSACSMCYGRRRLVPICYHGYKHLV